MKNNQMIKHELLQYTARLIEMSPLQNNLNPGAARHDVAALLVEQAMELGIEENGAKNLYVLKPILKASILIIQERINAMPQEDLLKYSVLARLKEEYLQTIATLEKILDNLK